MAEIDAFVWHDLRGNITAVGYVVGESKEQVEPLVHGDRRVLRTPLTEEQLSSIHLTHAVDPIKGTLAPRKYERSPSV
jgi:hypothetical protein